MDTPLSSESDCNCCLQAEKKQKLEAANTDSDGLSSESDCKCCSQAEKKQKLEAANTDSDGGFEDPSDGELEDDAFFNDGFHAMTKEEKRRYWKQVTESEGFDVDDFSKVFAMGLIVPMIPLEPEYELFESFTNSAINQYNEDNKNEQLKLVRVVKANAEGGFTTLYYITFEAIVAARDNEIKTFQALVAEKPRSEIKVHFCRPKPTMS